MKIIYRSLLIASIVAGLAEPIQAEVVIPQAQETEAYAAAWKEWLKHDHTIITTESEESCRYWKELIEFNKESYEKLVAACKIQNAAAQRYEAPSNLSDGDQTPLSNRYDDAATIKVYLRDSGYNDLSDAQIANVIAYMKANGIHHISELGELTKALEARK
jgi:hypothetical protein